jgi:hypothetical protein
MAIVVDGGRGLLGSMFHGAWIVGEIRRYDSHVTVLLSSHADRPIFRIPHTFVESSVE